MSAEFKWYVAHTYSGYENKVKDSIEKTVENRGLGDLIGEVCIPVEEAVEENDKGEKKTVTRKIYPGYVFIKMQMTDESWYVVRNTRGCTGFVGPGSKPVPLSEAEVMNLGVETATVDLGVDVGDTVRITDGSMEGFMGEVLEINHEKRKVSVMVTMFGGREMQVEFEFYQIEPLE
ncbi:MAG: transcription termination/antitermination factor NusG [Clostridia bacterium]|nr:transcription termination/antitermination factor NusG [Clostridia bacterium]MBR2885277.1 transcription termination/antitermination factor NusG [Clostridia bacterium]